MPDTIALKNAGYKILNISILTREVNSINSMNLSVCVKLFIVYFWEKTLSLALCIFFI